MINNNTVLIGLSGGVDSSVAAYLLIKKGYNVVGAFMKNFSDTKNKITGECSYLEDKKMAQKIAAKLTIPLIILDQEKEYKKFVINPMYKSYSKGKTPNPDTLCNKIIKFPSLRKKAKAIKANFIATGHYAKISKTNHGFSLKKGKDKKKDQSYFLYELSQKDLKNTLFPLENLTKIEVRKIAKKNKFPNWNKPGTRGICFVGKVNMKKFLQKKIPKKPGKVLNPDNEEIGSHPGAMFFTIGERIGPRHEILINNKFRNKISKKLYIAKKINNTIIIAPHNHPLLKNRKIKLKNLHLINPMEAIPNNSLKIRIRHLGELHSGNLKKSRNKFIFHLKKPIGGIAPGQAAVLYKGDKLIGGGIIE